MGGGVDLRGGIFPITTPAPPTSASKKLRNAQKLDNPWEKISLQYLKW